MSDLLWSSPRERDTWPPVALRLPLEIIWDHTAGALQVI
jgi:hypothetical protein